MFAYETNSEFDLHPSQINKIAEILGVDPDRTTEIIIRPMYAKVKGFAVEERTGGKLPAPGKVSTKDYNITVHNATDPKATAEQIKKIIAEES
jgi:hypothetical protein